jgi:hypothetical protein
MKLNIQVELEWLEEDGSLDEEVKHQIIEGVKRSISRDCLAKVEKQASAEIDKAISESIRSAQQTINQKALEFAEQWLEKEVTITDKWGDNQDCLTITDLIKRTFNNLLERKVNDRGEFANDSYGGMRLIDFLTGQRVRDVVAQHLKGINSDIEKAIKAEVENGIRKGVAAKFAEMVIQTAKADHQQLKLENQGA